MTGPALTILHLDEHIVAIDKPAWWVVHRSRGAKDAPIVLAVLRDQLGGEPLFPVHRLDRQASGVLVLARTREAASLIGRQLRDTPSAWRKRYLGLCRGVIAQGCTVDHPVPEGELRRPGQTHLDPLEVFCDRFTLVRATPATGRYHQIRYHLKHIGHPLVGDTNYGKGPINRFFRASFDLRRLFLHAESLRLLHPVEDRQLQLQAPLPPDLSGLLQALRPHRGPVP